MKIRIVLDIPDAMRRDFRTRDNRRPSGLATRKEIISHFNAVWDTYCNDITYEATQIVEKLEDDRMVTL
jgi:hypothetical protein